MLKDIFTTLTMWALTPWKSWIMHTVIAIPVAAIGGVEAVLWCYGFREAEQVLWNWRFDLLEETWLDSVLDVAIPVVATAILFGF